MLVDVGATDKEFDYLVPDKYAESIRLGSLVRVVLGSRRVAGWVVALDPEPPRGVVLRPLAGVRGWGPSPELIDLARWAAWRWVGPVAGFLDTASPPTAVKVLPGPPRPPSGREPGDEFPSGEVPLRFGSVVVAQVAPASDRMPLVVEALAQAQAVGADALILCPSHDEASSLSARLRAMNQTVALMPGQWSQARAGGCAVVGSRAAAWAPVGRLGAVLILDAHDQAYVEQRAPTWSAWAVAIERARRAGASCVLASPCPSLEMLDRASLSRAPRAEERQGWPVVEVIDRRGDDPRLGLFSDRLVDLVRSARPEPGHRVLCVLNRKGRARLLACARCGELARCERCHAALASVPTAASTPEPTCVLVCRRCGLERPEVCASCGSTRLKVLRAGVSRVRAEIQALVSFPVAEVTAGKPPVAASLGAWEGAEAAVIVGTEAVLHRVARTEVGSVAFLDFDQELLAPRFRAGETALALLARAGRLVGRRSAGGRVLVQTRVPDHEVLEAAARADPGRFRVAELATRQMLGLPPTRVLAIMTGDGAASFASALAEFGLEVSDAGTPGVPGHDGGGERVRWLVRAQDHHQLCSALAELERPPRGLRIEVDPVRI